MQGCKSAFRLACDDHSRIPCVGWLRRQKTPASLDKRARAILLVAEGHTCAATARQVDLQERHVRKWALRLLASGLDELYNTKRPGRKTRCVAKSLPRLDRVLGVFMHR
jgi:transposase